MDVIIIIINRLLGSLYLCCVTKFMYQVIWIENLYVLALPLSL